MRKLLFLGCLLLSTVPAIASCVKGSEKKGKDESVLSVIVEHNYYSLTVGDKVTARAKVEPASADLPGLTWTSEDPGVATVSGGTIEAVGPGETTIVVSCRQADGRITIKVKGKPEDQKPDNPVFPENFDDPTPARLYDGKPSKDNRLTDLALNGVAEYENDGLLVGKTGNLVRLNRFYALGTRLVRYRIDPSTDAVCLFQSSERDFTLKVDVPGKTMKIMTSPETAVDVPFLKGGKEYDVVVIHEYQKATVRILDVAGKDSVEVSAVNDGPGGVRQGVVNPNSFTVGPGWDYYCFGLESGSSMLVKRIMVESPRSAVRLLIYGDSITQPETYYPTSLFPYAWTQLFIKELGGNAISSGRGGCTINEVLTYIRNELPYIKAKYVMVTIGTNGGNTESNLTDLVRYIKSMGSIPILNNIPSNESGTQVAVNAVIETVRRNNDLEGARFDLATSLKGDGKEVDKTMMFWEDYPPTQFNGWQVWHHPNEKGSKAMFEQALKDLPELFEPTGND